jgi:hypothetical protein
MEIIVFSVSATLLMAFVFLLDDLQQGAVARRRFAKPATASVPPAVNAPRAIRKAA